MTVRLERPASLIRAAAQHAERVYAVAQWAAPAPDIEELSNSWQRSTNSVDPVDSRAPRILAAGDLKDSREPLGKLISAAQEKLSVWSRLVRLLLNPTRELRSSNCCIAGGKG
jgi:transcriptional regulator of acetoin/glycerol metabolism